jgi:hypothetical protein
MGDLFIRRAARLIAGKAPAIEGAMSRINSWSWSWSRMELDQRPREARLRFERLQWSYLLLFGL